MIIGLVYVVIAGIVYLASSKYNGNRPLRNAFMDIYSSRIRFGLLHDFLYLFSINVLVCAFMQFRFTENAGDTALGTISMLAFISGIAFLGYKLRVFQKTPYE